MPVYIVTRKSDGAEVTRYAAAAVTESVHPLAEFDHAELVEDATPATPTVTRLTKLQFIDRMGDDAHKAVLQMSKVNVDVEAFVQRFELATPDVDGTSVDLADPRTVAGVTAIGAALRAMGVVGDDWVSGVLNA